MGRNIPEGIRAEFNCFNDFTQVIRRQIPIAGRRGACNLKDSLHFPGQLLTGTKIASSYRAIP
jgi:hypothetical protein